MNGISAGASTATAGRPAQASGRRPRRSPTGAVRRRPGGRSESRAGGGRVGRRGPKGDCSCLPRRRVVPRRRASRQTCSLLVSDQPQRPMLGVAGRGSAGPGKGRQGGPRHLLFPRTFPGAAGHRGKPDAGKGEGPAGA